MYSMTHPLIYLDSAATTPLRPEALEAMRPWTEANFGNPSSLYHAGKVVKKALDAARAELAQGISALPDELFFTSGATEANNWVLKSVAFSRRRTEGRVHLITSQIEHSAVLDVFQWLETEGFEVTRLPVNTDGMVLPETLKASLRPDTALVSIMHGNNEMGAIQDIVALGHLAHQVGAVFHTDAVQTLGKLPLAFSELPIDFMSATAHKFGGPKGIGFLAAKVDCQPMLEPLLHGGGQEHGFRSGTENVAAIVGMAKAFEITLAEQDTVIPREQALQAWLIQRIQTLAPLAVLNGPAQMTRRVPGNVNFSFPPCEGETLVLRLDMKGFAVSSGSACHSATLTGSHVIRALGHGDAIAKSSLRVSIGRDTTQDDLEAFLVALEAVLRRAEYLDAAIEEQGVCANG
jgi:cysteine desulfurase